MAEVYITSNRNDSRNQWRRQQNTVTTTERLLLAWTWPPKQYACKCSRVFDIPTPTSVLYTQKRLLSTMGYYTEGPSQKLTIHQHQCFLHHQWLQASQPKGKRLKQNRNTMIECRRTYLLLRTCLMWWKTLMTSRILLGHSSILEARFIQAMAKTCKTTPMTFIHTVLLLLLLPTAARKCAHIMPRCSVLSRRDMLQLRCSHNRKAIIKTHHTKSKFKKMCQ